MTPLAIPALPLSTYRLQVNSTLTFADVEALIPYLSGLGITHLYLAPIWRSRPGSPHGYDICDPAEINPELGGEAGFHRLSAAAASHGIGLVLDFVSNHMCTETRHNPAWRDMLRNGPSSPYAEYFDIDWEPVKPELRDKMLLPILGRQYGEVLEAGELRLAIEDGEFSLFYWDHNLPLNPRQNRMILRHRLEELKQALHDDPEPLQEFQSILFQLDHMPSYVHLAPEEREDRAREIAVAGQRFHRLIEHSAVVRAHISRNIAEFNGWPGDAASFDLMHELLESQTYRLSYWRTAMHEINYRRFFDVNELAGIRVENPAVYEATHAKAFELLRRGLAHGLRLDHIDGLYDPAGYLQQLRDSLPPSAYIVVEKILSETEPLSKSWPVNGTTGYEFLNYLNRLYVRPGNMAAIRRTYQRFARQTANLDNVIYACKQQIIATSMASELNVLAHELNRMSEHDRGRRDFTLDSLQEALREVVACFQIYRTYINERGVDDEDRQAIDDAIQRAIARNPAMESSIFSFIRTCLCPTRGEKESDTSFARRLKFAMKFQQYTGPVQAKGIEDTAFYRYCPLASLNEVGGDPSIIGSPLDVFHSSNADRRQLHPSSMIATSTHDTKRGEDARARLNVLSEYPDEWRQKLREWSRLTAFARTRIDKHVAPDRNDEYLFYQNLLAIWPPGLTVPSLELVERMQQYMSKAIKEAKIHSSWINPSNQYDAAMAHFVGQTLQGKQAGRFLASFVPFAERLAARGEWNSLSQVTLKLASPGIPDFYQGTEFWDLTLVDPDNRKPIDFQARRRWLEAWLLGDPVVPSGAATAPEERKAAMTAIGLRFRRRHPRLFLEGEYVPLFAEGPAADHVVAFARIHGDDAVIAAGLRWTVGLWPDGAGPEAASGILGATRLVLPEVLRNRPLRNLYTADPAVSGESIPLTAVFGRLPGALLAGITPSTTDTAS